MCIASGVLCPTHKGSETSIKIVVFEQQAMTSEKFAGLMCECYLDLVQNKAEFRWFVEFFGLRLAYLFLNDFLLIACARALISIILMLSIPHEKGFHSHDDVSGHQSIGEYVGTRRYMLV